MVPTRPPGHALRWLQKVVDILDARDYGGDMTRTQGYRFFRDLAAFAKAVMEATR